MAATEDALTPGFVLALDFGGTKIDVGTATLDGRLVSSERIETRAGDGAVQAVERATDLAKNLAERTGGDCLGAGAVSPGVVKDDRVLLAPNVPGWETLRLPDMLRDGLGLASIAVGNDVNAAALAETRWGALAGSDVGGVVSLGTGGEGGVGVDGQGFLWGHGAAGGIGYSPPGAPGGAGV